MLRSKLVFSEEQQLPCLQLPQVSVQRFSTVETVCTVPSRERVPGLVDDREASAATDHKGGSLCCRQKGGEQLVPEMSITPASLMGMRGQIWTGKA